MEEQMLQVAASFNSHAQILASQLLYRGIYRWNFFIAIHSSTVIKFYRQLVRNSKMNQRLRSFA